MSEHSAAPISHGGLRSEAATCLVTAARFGVVDTGADNRSSVLEGGTAAGRYRRQPTNTTVLVIEPDGSLSMLLVDVLQTTGYRAVAIADGKDALRCAQRILPDAVLCNAHLPTLDGTAVALQLRGDAALANVPIIMMYAEAPSTEEPGLVDAFLREPTPIARLLATVEDAIQHRRRHRA